MDSGRKIISKLVLIETYWNVNSLRSLRRLRAWLVLIETYWNVNKRRCSIFRDNKPVLIETYWNVNQRRLYDVIKTQARLNRNILECKCVLSLVRDGGVQQVLIETYWNVNCNCRSPESKTLLS